MNILMLSVVFPYPINDGGRSGTFKMINELRKTNRITLICPHSNEENNLKLTQLWPDVKILTFTPLSSEINNNSLKEIIKNVLGKNKQTKEQQFSNAMVLNSTNLAAYYFNDLVEIVQQEIVENNFDLIQVDFIELAPIIGVLPANIKKIFVHHELRYHRMQLEYNTLGIIDFAAEWKIECTKVLEIGLLNKYDKVVCLTENDKNVLKNEGVMPEKLEVSPLPVNIQDHPVSHEFEFDNSLVFLGPNAHFPNWDGIDWFLNHCWDKLLQERPELTLNIVGRWSEKIMKQYEQIKNINFLGYVPELSSVASGSIMIVPLRIGSGMRMKILEGVSWHIPIISTSVGAEGLPMRDGENCFIADSPEEFNEKILALSESSELQNKFIKTSVELIKGGYSVEECAKKRQNIYEA